MWAKTAHSIPFVKLPKGNILRTCSERKIAHYPRKLFNFFSSFFLYAVEIINDRQNTSVNNGLQES